MQVIGTNALTKYMKSMFQEAGIDCSGRNIQNHSGKVTLCTKLYEKNHDEQAIMGRSGHRSVAVRNYKRQSVALQMEVSNDLQHPLPKCMKSEKPLPPKSDKDSTEESPVISKNVSASETRIIMKATESLQGRGFVQTDTHTLSVPECINTVIIDTMGKKVKISL